MVIAPATKPTTSCKDPLTLANDPPNPASAVRSIIRIANRL